jgi:hypothetical protein
MEALCDIFARIRGERESVIREEVLKISVTFNESMKSVLVSFLNEVLATRQGQTLKFACVVVDNDGKVAALPMLRLGVSPAPWVYGNVYFCNGEFFRDLEPRKEPLFQTPRESGSSLGHRAAFHEVRKLTDSEILQRLLTEDFFGYLDITFGKAVRAQEATLLDALAAVSA